MIYDVHSFDFDGCLANITFLKLKYKEIKDIIEANRKLLDIIKTSPNRKIVISNSNRQAPRDDLANSGADERGSCYHATKAVAAYLNAEFDGFLLADIYNDLRPGKALKQALKYIAENNKDYTKEVRKGKIFSSLYNWIHDESKLTTVYAQMHELALSHSDDDAFNFYFTDDREDLLNELHIYFSQYPQMIPRNVKLCLRHYRGPIDRDDNEITPLFHDYTPIQGTREKPDENYRQTVKSMAAVTIEQMTEKGIDIAANYGAKAAIVTTYADAQKCNFDMSAIKCVHYYVPDAMPKHPPKPLSAKKEKQFAVKKAHACDAREAIEKTTSLHAESSSSTSISLPVSTLNAASSSTWTPASKSNLTLKSALTLRPILTVTPTQIATQIPAEIPTQAITHAPEATAIPDMTQTPAATQIPTFGASSSTQEGKFGFFRKNPDNERKVGEVLGRYKNKKDTTDAGSSHSGECDLEAPNTQNNSIGASQSNVEESNTSSSLFIP